ncbi:LysR substrate-binding domain-containing protein [Burkholderia sp. NLJ2]|uniref:LysR family transcriptional regulator n=1 Tax=Burkholderia sp. NLJ2 TaxID=3090699 RepID=UPI003C6BEC69
MDKIQSVRFFLQVVEEESFVRVANRSGVSDVAIRRHVAWLETQTGAQLLVRKSRSVAVTEFGQTYYARMRSILAKLDELERSISEPSLKPIGTLRVAVSSFFSLRYLTSCLGDYRNTYPDVSISPIFLDRPFDLVRDGYDVGITDLSTLSNSSFIARPICHGPLIACASPAYLERCGEPLHPEQLTGHSYIKASGLHSGGPGLKITGHGGTVTLDCKPVLVVNNVDFLVQMILAGTGVSFVPPALIESELQNGALKPVLTGYSSPAPAIGIVYPSRRHLPAKVRTFVEHLLATFDTSSGM